MGQAQCYTRVWDKTTVRPETDAERIRAVKNKKTGRKKTSIACYHCWKAKTRCAIKRPCDRCKRLGKHCFDRPANTRKRQHKYRIPELPTPPTKSVVAANITNIPKLDLNVNGFKTLKKRKGDKV